MGTSALNARTFLSSRLYLKLPRNSSSVSAGFDFSTVTRFFQISPFGIFCSAAIGLSVVDVVAIVDEKIRPVLSHRRIGTHPAARLVDAPALSSGVAGPHEADGASIAQRSAETA